MKIDILYDFEILNSKQSLHFKEIKNLDTFITKIYPGDSRKISIKSEI